MASLSSEWKGLDSQTEMSALKFAYQSIMTGILYLLQSDPGQPTSSTESYLQSARRELSALVSMCHSAEKQTAVNFLNWWGPIIDHDMFTSLTCTSGQFCSTQRRHTWSYSATSLRHPTSAISTSWKLSLNASLKLESVTPWCNYEHSTRNFWVFLRSFSTMSAMRCRGSVHLSWEVRFLTRLGAPLLLHGVQMICFSTSSFLLERKASLVCWVFQRLIHLCRTALIKGCIILDCVFVCRVGMVSLYWWHTLAFMNTCIYSIKINSSVSIYNVIYNKCLWNIQSYVPGMYTYIPLVSSTVLRYMTGYISRSILFQTERDTFQNSGI